MHLDIIFAVSVLGRAALRFVLTPIPPPLPPLGVHVCWRIFEVTSGLVHNLLEKDLLSNVAAQIRRIAAAHAGGGGMAAAACKKSGGTIHTAKALPATLRKADSSRPARVISPLEAAAAASILAGVRRNRGDNASRGGQQASSPEGAPAPAAKRRKLQQAAALAGVAGPGSGSGAEAGSGSSAAGARPAALLGASASPGAAGAAAMATGAPAAAAQAANALMLRAQRDGAGPELVQAVTEAARDAAVAGLLVASGMGNLLSGALRRARAAGGTGGTSPMGAAPAAPAPAVAAAADDGQSDPVMSPLRALAALAMTWEQADATGCAPS